MKDIKGWMSHPALRQLGGFLVNFQQAKPYGPEYRIGRRPLGWMLMCTMVCLIYLPGTATAQHKLPAALEITVIGKMLGYDQNLSKKTTETGTVPLALLYNAKKKNSEQQADEIITAIRKLGKQKIISGKTLQPFKVAYQTAEQAQKAITSQKATLVYVCEGMDDRLEEIVKFSHNTGILTIGANPSYIDAGISIGVFLNGNKPQMVVNLAASRAEGCNFSAALLKLASVIR
ncbi:MAG: YfiR family protein [Deltaproteobacteria bacterium]|nr:YfiR family protein [Deltaproteobacteria bacterium]